MTAERILVTGGSGFAGSHLARDLHRDGSRVVVLTRSAERAREVLPEGIELVEGDIVDPKAVRQSAKGCAVVFHLASSFREAGIPDERHRAVHVEGTRLLLEAALEEGVRRFVHCSTIGVHSHIKDPPADETAPHTPGDIYQATKSEAEKLALDFARSHDLPLSVARPTAIYGPGDMRLLKLFRLIDRGLFVMLGDGTPRFHLVHVADLVRGFRLLGEREEALGEVFILGGEERPTLNELVALIADILDARRPRLHLPARPFQIAGELCERIFVPLGIEPPIFRRRVDFFTKNRCFSIGKAKRVLGYRPRIGLEEGLRETAAWYRDHGHL